MINKCFSRFTGREHETDDIAVCAILGECSNSSNISINNQKLPINYTENPVGLNNNVNAHASSDVPGTVWRQDTEGGGTHPDNKNHKLLRSVDQVLQMDNLEFRSLHLESANSFPTAFNLTLNKCICPAGHVNVLGGQTVCLKTKTTPFNLLVEPLSYKIINITEIDIETVQVIKFRCSRPKQILHLSQDEYLLLLNGDVRHKISNTVVKSQDLCMENVEHEHGIREWVAMACLRPPKVRKCCPERFLVNSTSALCTKIHESSLEEETKNIVTFNPPIEVDHLYTSINVEINFDKGIPKCLDREILVRIPLGNFSDYLVQIINHISEVKLLLVQDDFQVQKYYDSEKYCVDKYDGIETEYFAMICYEDEYAEHVATCAENEHCIRKCCPEDKVIDMISLDCQSPLEQKYLFKPEFYMSSWNDHMIRAPNIVSYKVIHGEPLCHPVDIREDNFFLLDDGTVYFPEKNIRFSSESYCIDSRQGYRGQTDVALHYCEWRGQSYGNACWRVRAVLYPIMEVISCIFLLVTLVVYKIVPELRANIFGKSLVSHVFALLVALVCIVVISLGQISKYSAGLCQSMGKWKIKKMIYIF